MTEFLLQASEWGRQYFGVCIATLIYFAVACHHLDQSNNHQIREKWERTFIRLSFYLLVLPIVAAVSWIIIKLLVPQFADSYLYRSDALGVFINVLVSTPLILLLAHVLTRISVSTDSQIE